MGQYLLKMAREASSVLNGIIRYTPLDYSSTFSKLAGNSIFLKLENLQKTGSFKIRGAYNALNSLTEEEKEKGVIAASAGNHAQGVAWAASNLGIEVTIVMPENAPLSKIVATTDYGAKVVLAEGGYDEAYRRALKIQQESKATYIHSFDSYPIIAGQGTIALELLNQLPDIDTVVVPVGGGGLIAGIAGTIKQVKPGVEVIGVQAEGARALYQSKKSGRLEKLETAPTIADGIAVGKPGEKTFEIIHQYVDDIVTVDDEEISRSILFLLERAKNVVEGAGAVGIAALLQKKINISGKKVAVILSGGNIDMNLISVIIERGLIKEGRRIELSCTLEDSPGSLQKLLEEIARCKGNVISILHDRVSPGVQLKKAQVKLILETRDEQHITEIKKVLKDKGYFY